MANPRHRIIGTAGHVDHGKTALVFALTGVDTDRLAEEKRRGITIENGYAHLTLPDGRLIGVIDVPGHERFVRHMLAGSGGVDIALLVVAADDGIMPQTREHLDILKLLGVKRAVVALSKIDLAPDKEWIELVSAEIGSLLNGVFEVDPPIIPVSTRTGQGIENLRQTLFAAVEACPAKPVGRHFRLPLDRVFTRPGFGTVVAGTLLGGTVSLGDPALVYPAGQETRIRQIQTHSQVVETAYPGQRVALNLANLKKEDLNRGDVLATPGSLTPSLFLDAQIAIVPTSPFSLKNGRQAQIHLAAREVRAKVILMGTAELAAGQTDYAQLRLAEPVVARRGDRLVIRLSSPAITIGGGEVLDPAPQRRRRNKPETLKRYETLATGGLRSRVELAVRERPGAFATIKELILRSDLGSQALAEAKILADKGVLLALAPDIFIHVAEFTALTNRLQNLLARYHQENPFSPGLSLEEIRSRLAPRAPSNAMEGLFAIWVAKKLALREEGLMRLSSFEPQVDEAKNQYLELLAQSYESMAWSPLATSAVLPALTPESARNRKAAFASLIQSGRLERLNDLYHMAQKPYQKAFEEFKTLAQKGPVEPGPFRDRLQTSRKVAVALLENYEKKGWAIKSGAGRLPR
ncbi:MAG: selenocysteine-specific translation elongation factor [Deltaproteobacteria bacterium]|jgi:selenocysteine-specific elongation factor|nr:selenocysteine-specific translation elongation factor [Deltaproteobacteria bacterium]